MAEINIQRKSSNAIWWVIGIVVLAVVVWWLMSARTTEYNGALIAPDDALAASALRQPVVAIESRQFAVWHA